MLQKTTEWILYSLIGLDSESSIVSMFNFFIYDTIKVILILFVMIAIISYIRTYLPQKKVKKWLEKRRFGSGNFIAAFFGALTPFCSCSSIPIFISFIKARIPLGIAFSFLVTSPIVNEYLVVLMLGFFGWKITLIYVIAGILIGVASGLILGGANLNKYVAKDFLGCRMTEQKFKSKKERIRFGINEAKLITYKLWLWIVVGVGIGAIIHNYVPQEFLQSIISKGGPFTVPIATFIGVPLYASCAAILPIAIVLFNKGIPLGTALAFMMATSALSLPEAAILKRAMKIKLLSLFFVVVTIAIITIGYLFNYLQPFLT